MHEHFDTVDCRCLGAEYAAERLATEIRVDLGEEHLVGGCVVAYDERVLITEYVLLGDLDGFICSSFWLTRSLSHVYARMHIPIFKFIENVFDLFENSCVLSGSYRVI